MSLIVLNYRDSIPEHYRVIDTTSRSKELWSKNLSPFLVGKNVKLYGHAIAHNIENAWQYSKVYEEFVDENKNVTSKYFVWAQKGFKSHKAQRYPMGKRKRPLYSYWNGYCYDYIEARKKIYIPLYSREVIKTQAYSTLLKLYNASNIALLDFDGYDKDALNMSYKEVVNNPNKKMGHAFVLAMLLEGFIKPGEILK